MVGAAYGGHRLRKRVSHCIYGRNDKTCEAQSTVEPSSPFRSFFTPSSCIIARAPGVVGDGEGAVVAGGLLLHWGDQTGEREA